MAKRAHAPIHPGEILDREFFEPYALSASRVARDLSIPSRQLREIVRCVKPISANLALRLARYFGTSDEFWLNLQMRYDLAIERGRLGKKLAREVTVLQRVS
jgi:addiction module HigA family antidote